MIRRATFSPILVGLLIFAFSAAVMIFIFFRSDGLYDQDSFYHTRLSAEIIAQRSVVVNFVQLPLTTLDAARFTDHHFLFHLFLAPWAYFGGLNGAKLAAAGIAAGVIVAIWALLRMIGVRWSAVWALATLALSSQFLLRVLAIRTEGASLLLLIIALALLFTRRYRWLILLGFAYTWLYDGFVLLPVIAALYVLAVWIDQRRLDWQPIVYAVIGIALGLVINPYFPRNIAFVVDHLVQKVDIGQSIPVGAEWYARGTDRWLRDSAGAFLVLVIGVLYPSFGTRRRDAIDTTLLFCALLTLLMTFIWNRFIDYYPAFALLFCAATWGRGGVDLLAFMPNRLRFRWLLAAGGIALPLAFGCLYVYQSARIVANESIALSYLAGASAWLQANTPEGSLIFNSAWDDFPPLFYHNTHNAYISGLDPTYLYLANPELWQQFQDTVRGRIDHPSSVIRSAFGTEYIVTNSNDVLLLPKLEADPDVEIVYQDDASAIWRIIS